MYQNSYMMGVRPGDFGWRCGGGAGAGLAEWKGETPSRLPGRLCDPYPSDRGSEDMSQSDREGVEGFPLLLVATTPWCVPTSETIQDGATTCRNQYTPMTPPRFVPPTHHEPVSLYGPLLRAPNQKGRA
jgi:hypothetical protein